VRTLFYNSDPRPEQRSEVFVPIRSEVFVPMKLQEPRADIPTLLATLAKMMASLVTIIGVTKK
jgi:hypothetical protein